MRKRERKEKEKKKEKKEKGKKGEGKTFFGREDQRLFNLWILAAPKTPPTAPIPSKFFI